MYTSSQLDDENFWIELENSLNPKNTDDPQWVFNGRSFTTISSEIKGYFPLIAGGDQIILQQSDIHKSEFIPRKFNINAITGDYNFKFITYQWQLISVYENNPILIGDPINGLQCENKKQIFTLDFPKQIKINTDQRLQLVVSSNCYVSKIIAVVFC